MENLSSKNYLDLISSLYALVLYLEDKKPPKSAFVSSALRPFYDLIEELKPSLSAASKGTAEDFEALGKSLRPFIRSYSEYKEHRTPLLQLFKAFASYFSSGSPSAYKTLKTTSTAVSAFPDFVRQGFLEESSDQRNLVKDAKLLFKKLTKKDGLFFEDMEEQAKAKSAKPELYSEYQTLVKEINSAWKNELKNFVISAGKPSVFWEDFEDHLASKKMIHTFPEGFTGQVDANANWLSSDGEELSAGAPSKSFFPKVKMNPNPSPENSWIFMGVRKDGSAGNYFYTRKAVKERKQGKFKAVQSLSSSIQKIRSNWLKDLKKFSLQNPESVTAVILELLYSFSARVGNLGNEAGGTPTFGISTLKVKNLKFLPANKVRFDYQGKDNVKTVHNLAPTDATNTQLVNALKTLVEGKPKDEFVFTYLRGDNRVRVPYSFINKYFRSKGAPAGVTVRNLRTLRATSVWNERLEELFSSKETLTMREANEFRKEVGRLAGEHLNHVRRGAGGESITHATALASYIDVQAQIELYNHYGLPLPPDLQTRSKSEVFSSTQPSLEAVYAALEEPTPEEPVAEEPPREAEPTAENPVAEEPSLEAEPTAEEPVAEEPSTEEDSEVETKEEALENLEDYVGDSDIAQEKDPEDPSAEQYEDLELNVKLVEDFLSGDDRLFE